VEFDKISCFSKKDSQIKENIMATSVLGKIYKDGETVFLQNDVGNCMYVVLSGQVEIIQTNEGKEVRLAVLGEGNFFGEMAIFEKEKRSATVRTVGDVHLLTIDKKNFLRRIHEDPSLAYHLVQSMSNRIRNLNLKHTRIASQDRRNWETRPNKIDGNNDS